LTVDRGETLLSLDCNSDIFSILPILAIVRQLFERIVIRKRSHLWRKSKIDSDLLLSSAIWDVALSPYRKKFSLEKSSRGLLGYQRETPGVIMWIYLHRSLQRREERRASLFFSDRKTKHKQAKNFIIASSHYKSRDYSLIIINPDPHPHPHPHPHRQQVVVVEKNNVNSNL